MAALSTSGSTPQLALQRCVSALKRMATYTLDPTLDQKMRDLGERKDFLNPGEHVELMALVAFTQQRSIEKLEAELALQQLQAAFPELVGAP
jgi:hypothetical protein